MSLISSSLCIIAFAIVWVYVPQLLEPTLPEPTVEGFVRPEFKKVADVFRANVASGKEKGGAFAAFYKGERIVDLWGGWADEDAERKWKEDTITMLFSSTKGVAAIMAAWMVDKGWLDYKKPVSDYWPEFAQNGKGQITVEMLLSHQAGLAYLNQSIPLHMVTSDPKRMESLLAAEEPKWKPGTMFGYHSMTFGLYVDILLSKADPKHRPVQQIFAEEFAKPLGLDLYIGTPPREHHRSAKIVFIPAWKSILSGLLEPQYWKFYLNWILVPDSVVAKSLKSVTLKDSSTRLNVYNDPDIRKIPCTSITGSGTAGSLAKLYGILGNGGIYKGKAVFSKETLDKLVTPLASGTDITLSTSDQSVGPGTRFFKNPKGGSTVGHPGFGGQQAIVDIDNHLGLSYLTNYQDIRSMGDVDRFLDLQKALYECLETYQTKKV